MILLILKILFPLFFAIFIGWYAGMKGVIPEAHAKSLVNFIILIATPALLFSITSTKPIEEFFNLKTVAVIVIGLLLTYIKTYMIYHYNFKKHPKESSQASLISAFPNAAFMGLPIVLNLYGEGGVATIIIGSLAVFLIITPLTMFLVDYHDKTEEVDLRSMFIQMIKLFKSPILLAPVLGIIISALHIQVPEFIASGFKFLGDTAPAISLFATGLFMAYTRIAVNLEVIVLIVIRNIVSPLIFLGVMLVAGVKGHLFNEVLLVSAMPTASTAPMFAGKFGTYESETSAATVLGTIFSIFTLGGLILILT